MDDSPETPSLTEVLETALEYHAGVLRVGLPGKVVDYDKATRTATIQPLVGRYLELQDGGERAEPLPQLVGVPVEFPGGDTFEIVWPLKQGATGMLHFADSSLDEWKDKANEAVTARDVRQHHLADAVFRPGLRSPRAPGTTPRDDALVLGILSGMSIHVTETGISLGEPSAAYAVALAEQVAAALNQLKQAFTAWVPAGTLGDGVALKTMLAGFGISSPAPTVPPDPPPPAPSPALSWPPDLGSTTVKVKG